MKRINDDADGSEHSAHGEVGTNAVFDSVGFYVVERPDSIGD